MLNVIPNMQVNHAHPHRANTAPMLLLVSRALPAPDGDAPQRRAWDALRLAASNRRVCLVTVATDRIHLSQWRQLSALAEHIELVPGGRGLGFARRWKRAIDQVIQRHPIARVYRVDDRGSQCVSIGDAATFRLPTARTHPLQRAA